MTELDSVVLHSDILVIILVIKPFTNYINLYKDKYAYILSLI
jgi:hypothetical protein